jgi:1-acyl-sn-glycerol-3-phosphate acyltransferase
LISYIKIFFIAIDCLIIAILTILVSPFDRNGRIVHYLSKVFSKVILSISGVKINVSGIEYLDPKEKYIFVSNHLSYYDIPILMQCIPNTLRFIYKKSMNKIPLFGWAMYLGKYIPIDRSDGRSALKSLRRASQIIKKGISVSIFPEGTRSKDGKIGEFKKGIFVLADEANEMIVPITIIGTNKILPKHKFRIVPGEARIIIHKPMAFKRDKYFLQEIRDTITSVYLQ